MHEAGTYKTKAKLMRDNYRKNMEEARQMHEKGMTMQE